MNNYRTVNETAAIWEMNPSMIIRYCHDGKIPGAIKINGEWMIPCDAVQPHQFKKRTSITDSLTMHRPKPLPIGTSNFIEACSDYYYIDKTMLIKDFLDERPKVVLFTRPRRFGKTLTMDMIRTFFEKTDNDNSIYFKDKKIFQQGLYYQQEQGKYPVIYLSFKDAKKNSWELTLDHISQLITSEYRRHKELKTSNKIQNHDYYDLIAKGYADHNLLDISLKELTQMLHEHHGVAPIVIIDEYDTPIEHGYTKGFYGDAVDFMRNLFSGAFKNKDHLSYGFLTGILRIAKESIFSGLNNFKIYSVLDDKYSQYFGFTKDDVLQMAKYYDKEDKYQEILYWYDCYHFGNTDIFNPWSVINYFSDNCRPRPFWENTGSNTIIKDILENADSDIYTQLNSLLQGKEITTIIDTNVIYPEIRKNTSSIYSFLLVAGYLTASSISITSIGDLIANVSLPNREIAYVYRKEVIGKLSTIIPQSISVSVQESLYLSNAEALEQHIHRFLLESVSSFDLINENAYHMLMLGLCAIMSDRYYLSSNKESGEGRFDIQLMPKDISLPGILIELKHSKDSSSEKLNRLALEAINQINTKQYDTEMKSKGINTIIKYGVAFSGKDVKIIKE